MRDAERVFSSHGVACKEKNIRDDPEGRRELVEDLNSRATPTLVVGNKVAVGFDPSAYEAALRLFRK